jgi:DNA-binding winged helix-turn-helix (wHTH) protein
MIHRFHNYELDDRLYELRRLGERVELERKVFDVLLYLVRHRDRVVTKAELNEAVWNGVAVSDAALVRCVVEARRAVGDDGVRQEVIETRRGRGYRFVAEARGDEPATTGARVETARPVAGGAGGLAPSLSAVHVGARAEAYDYFLRGLEHFMRMTREGNAVAREMAQRALELDPDFAAAFTALGWTHVRDWMNFWTLDAGVLESAARLAERALQLDEGLAMTHTLMAAVALYQLDHVRALHETERALTLDSTAPECLAIRSLVASHAGLADGARDAIEQAMSLNPQYPAFYLSHLGRAPGRRAARPRARCAGASAAP